MIADLALQRLLRCQMSSGLVRYEADLSTGRVSNRDYNMVRLAGVAYSLCWASEVYDRDGAIGLRESAERTVAFLLFSAEINARGFFVSEYSEESGFIAGSKLGSTALLTLALTFAPFREQYATQLGRLINGIAAAQMPMGAFSGDLCKAEASSQRYAPGEAILALVRYAEQTGEQHVLRGLDGAFQFYRRYYRFDPHPGFLLWHVDAWSRASRLPFLASSQRREYAAFAEYLSAPLLAKQHRASVCSDDRFSGGIAAGARPGVATSLYVECLCRTAGLLREQGREAELPRYREAIQAGLGFIARLSVGETEAAHLANKEFFLGGFRMHPESSQLRMDNDQHVATSCLAAIEEQLV
jgi:hypothetical protein